MDFMWPAYIVAAAIGSSRKTPPATRSPAPQNEGAEKGFGAANKLVFLMKESRRRKLWGVGLNEGAKTPE
jgi:hypothetical protein